MYPVANLASLPKGASGESERKLFVRGLSWDTTTEGLRNEFQKYGEIEEASVIKDRKTGKSKGFGFVTFRYKNAADRALQQPNKLIDVRRYIAFVNHLLTFLLFPPGSKYIV
jgi:RNA recognition motif-containing protein